MKTRTALRSGSIGLLAAISIAAWGAAPTSIEWRTDLELSRKLAASIGRPLLIVFR